MTAIVFDSIYNVRRSMADEAGRATAAQVGLPDVMEHLAIAFGGIYEKLTERDREVAALCARIKAQDERIQALRLRIAAHERRLVETYEPK